VSLVTGYAEARTLLGDARLAKNTLTVGELHGHQVTSTGVASGTMTKALAAHMNNADPPTTRGCVAW